MSSYRQILVDGSPIGLRGLDEVFLTLRAAVRKPGDASLGLEIVEHMRRENYIPHSAIDVFAAAFEREYATYLAQMENGDHAQRRDYGMWHGYPREAIPWFPTVNEDVCNGCGVCLKLCSTQCMAPAADGSGCRIFLKPQGTQCLISAGKGKVRVADPFACVVGCSSCATACRPKAITFPPLSLLEAYESR